MTTQQSGDSVVLSPLRDPASDFKVRRILPSSPRHMIGPFVLMDQMGPADFNSGRGLDRPPHPHIGVEKITYLIDGEIVERDSLGKVQNIRPGEVNWMAAGSGLVHSERTPSNVRESGSNLFGVQAWVALPLQHEEATADTAHYGTPEIPRICARGVEFTLIAGTSDGLISPVKTFSDLVFASIVLTSGARYQVKPLYRERALYIVAGEIEIVGLVSSFKAGELFMVEPGAEIVIRAPAFHSARLMLMGGEPLAEPRHMYWNFVSTSVERIEQAKRDWREGRFPAVPGEKELTPLPQDNTLLRREWAVAFNNPPP